MLLTIRTPASLVATLLLLVPSCGALAQTPADQILLKDYRPRSIFKIPETRVEKARYPIIDVHSHNYAPTDADVDRWVKTMDQVGVAKTIILSGATGAKFDEIVKKYGRYPDRFEVWCGFDYAKASQPDFAEAAAAELERCRNAGAKGVGELSDKGRGLSTAPGAAGLHIDDPRMDPLLEKCADLRLPINIHVGEDKWMYEPMDLTNDGSMHAFALPDAVLKKIYRDNALQLLAPR